MMPRRGPIFFINHPPSCVLFRSRNSVELCIIGLAFDCQADTIDQDTYVVPSVNRLILKIERLILKIERLILKIGRFSFGLLAWRHYVWLWR